MKLSGRGRSRRTAAWAFAMLATLAPAGAVYGQDADPLGPAGAGDVDLAAFVGWLSPIADLTADPATFGTSIDPFAAFGADVTYWFSDRWGIGGFGIYSPSELAVEALPADTTAPAALGDANYFAGALNLIYRIPSSGSRSAIEPFLAAGGGIRHLNVDDVAAPQVESRSNAVATLAAGVRVPLSRSFWLRAELRDFASFYDSPTTGEGRLQNDVTITIGFGTRFR